MFDKLIQEMIENATKNIIAGVSKEILSSSTSFENICSKTQDTLNTLGINLIQAICTQIDNIYEENRDRKVYYIKNTKERTILTSFGNVKLVRRLYRDNKTKQCFFALDELLSIPKHTRIETGLQAKLVEKATKTSFGEASRSISNNLSRQSIFNIVKNNVNLSQAKQKVEERKTIKELFIEADEDHIHLNDGKSAEVKLVYVHEGREEKGDRKELQNAKFFASVGSAEKIWSEVGTYVYTHYDISKCKIHLSGDGAEWIKNGCKDYFPGAIFHLDKFHVYKSITGACSFSSRSRSKIINALKIRDYDALESAYSNLIRNRLYTKKQMAENSFSYLDNNFDEITLVGGCPCSAEGHVSHVLSARMSSRPMGWSKSGAERIAKLRAFLYNKGNFYKIIKKRSNILKGKEVAKTINSSKKNYKNFYSCYAAVPLLCEKKTPYSDLLRGICS